MTMVVINDYVDNRKVKLLFSNDDFAVTDREWNNSDQLLHNLQHHAIFEGRTKWSDLEPYHFRMMLTKSLQIVSDLGDEERIGDNESVRSLNFLVCCLIRCIEHRSDCHIEMLKINRVGELDVAFEYSAALSVEIPVTKKKIEGFSVIVDNT